MSGFDENLLLPDEFDGIVPMFPLPELVLFPGVGQMLHVFEPRYRVMTEDSLGSNRLIAMVQLHPDRIDEHGMPLVASTVCIGRILTEVKMEDGRYHLFLVGVSRARIMEEIESDKPYRIARVETLPMPLPNESVFAGERQALLDLFLELAEIGQSFDPETIEKFIDPEVPLSRLVDMIAYAAGFGADQKQLVLDQNDLAARLQLVMKMLQNLRVIQSNNQRPGKEFPPRFSVN